MDYVINDKLKSLAPDVTYEKKYQSLEESL